MTLLGGQYPKPVEPLSVWPSVTTFSQPFDPIMASERSLVSANLKSENSHGILKGSSRRGGLCVLGHYSGWRTFTTDLEHSLRRVDLRPPVECRLLQAMEYR